MTKLQAIERMISEFSAVPLEWVKIVAEHNSDYPTLPMWGTMWIVDSMYGEKLLESSRCMAYDKESIDLNEIGGYRRKEIEKAIKEDNWLNIEQYVDEEMSGERCVLDKDGNTTAVFIYEIGDEHVIGINGAGWNFYDDVWDKLYDLMGLQWHEEEK